MYTKTQRVILALGTAGIAATGAIAGAQIKADREKPPAMPKEDQPQSIDAKATPKPPPARQDVQAIIAQRIAALDGQRGALMTQRFGVERKLEALMERKEANKEREARRAGAKDVLENEKK